VSAPAGWFIGYAARVPMAWRLAADRMRRRFDRWCCEPPQTRDDILTLARQVESDQPSLAAELRWIAWHRPNDISVAPPRLGAARDA
jgi:branched-subunit amino acid aminotransferase/4-amino-4-deoxychorismate lyase